MPFGNTLQKTYLRHTLIIVAAGEIFNKSYTNGHFVVMNVLLSGSIKNFVATPSGKVYNQNDNCCPGGIQMNNENSCYKIAVVDDDELFAAKIVSHIREYWNTKKLAVKIYPAGTDLADCLKRGLRYDIYFLDIEMPEINGLKLAESIMKLSAQACIVFITSYERYALQSIKIGAFYYILKEESDRELKTVLDKISREESGRRRTRCFLAGKGSAYEKICLDDIYYIERNGKNAVFYCSDARYYRKKAAENSLLRTSRNRLRLYQQRPDYKSHAHRKISKR